MFDLLHDLIFDYTLRNVALGAGLLGVVSGILGSFAVLRQQGLLGDALSHAALPGICLAFLLTGSKATLVLLLGAGLAGWVGTLLLLRIVRDTRISEDAALGIVLSTFFGFGIVLLTVISKRNDANQAGLDRYLFGQAATLREENVITMAVLGAVALVLVLLFYKEFKLLTFDPDFAASLGFPVDRLSVLLTSLMVVAVVIGLQTVGVVLMAAMLIGPAVAARQWTDRLGVMLALAALFGALAGVSGALISVSAARLPTGPMIILSLTSIVLLSLLLAPAHGALPQWWRRRRQRAALLGGGMTYSDLVVVLTGVLIASACALLGTFLVLRKMAMMADAISHAILPGIVAGYFLANGPDLLFGFAGAALAGVVTVAAVEALQGSRRVGGQAAIGIVFPAMFALGTILVSRFFSSVHLDTDAVLYGNIEFAAHDVLIVGDANLGPQSIWVMGGLLLLNLLFVGLFYKELKLATFDPGLAAALGFSPVMVHYALMTVMSVTTVGAFTAVGAILVVALMIVPAATAYLLTDRLPVMIGLAVLVGALSAASGFAVAVAIDASVAGAMASMTGLFFGLALLFSPLHGLVARARRLSREQARVAAESLVIHLLNHEGDPAESAVEHLSGELRWAPDLVQATLRSAEREGLIQRDDGHLVLTEQGRAIARNLRTA